MFEKVQKYVYRTSQDADNVSEQINRRMKSDNKCYCSLQKHFKSRLLTWTLTYSMTYGT